jgi:hypothetical protein
MNNTTKVITLCLLVFVLAACSQSSSSIQTAIAQTQVGWTPVPTQTPYPTHTPYPTNTPRPTVVVMQTIVIKQTQFVTPIPPAQFTEIKRFEGTGSVGTDVFRLATGHIRINWEYKGSSNFAFYLERPDNDARELVFNAIGSATGSQIYEVGSGEYFLNVKYGAGNWIIWIEYRP